MSAGSDARIVDRWLDACESCLELLAHANVQPGHVNYRTKGEMSDAARLLLRGLSAWRSERAAALAHSALPTVHAPGCRGVACGDLGQCDCEPVRDGTPCVHCGAPVDDEDYTLCAECFEAGQRAGSAPEPDSCPGCGEPCHATEGDEGGYHAGCRPAVGDGCSEGEGEVPYWYARGERLLASACDPQNDPSSQLQGQVRPC